MTEILSYLDVSGQSIFAGHLHSTVRRGRLRSTFSYSPGYLAAPNAYALEPGLPLTAGTLAFQRPLPRCFDDAAPDRWGRNLIAKRLRAEAAARGQTPPQLDERDFLLGVSDISRQGALRFKTATDGEFLHATDEVPRLIALPKLMRAAQQVARDEPGNLAAIKELLDAGTGSLGGARPKASVKDGDTLCIAKFGHHADDWNVIAWEKTARNHGFLRPKKGLDAGSTLRCQSNAGLRSTTSHQYRRREQSSRRNPDSVDERPAIRSFRTASP